jgi:hypothetical protein
MTLRLKLFTALIVGLLVVGGGWGVMAGQAPAKKAEPIKTVEQPKEVKIPEARADKVLLFQEQDERVRLEQQLLIEKFKASSEWKALEDRQRAINEKLAVELSSALKAVGITEIDFDKYTYDKSALTFKRKEADPKK